MNRYSLFDWQTMHLRKEIEDMHKQIKKDNAVDFAIIAELILLYVGFALDRAFDTRGNATLWTWVLIAVIGCIIVIGVWGFKSIPTIISRHRGKWIYGAKDIVDLIDNKLCYYLMTARAMMDNGIEVNGDIDRFYLIETSYYANKCVAILQDVRNNLQNVITWSQTPEEYRDFRISVARISNILQILLGIYSSLRDVDEMKESENKDACIKRISDENKYFEQELQDIKKELKKTFPEI